MSEGKRRYDRHIVVVRVQVWEKDHWADRATIDVSRGGILLAADTPLPVGHVLKLRLWTPAAEPIEVMAKVQRAAVGEAPGGLGVAVGLEFLTMGKAERARWDAFVLEHSRLLRLHALREAPALFDALPDPGAATEAGAGEPAGPAPEPAARGPNRWSTTTARSTGRPSLVVRLQTMQQLRLLAERVLHSGTVVLATDCALSPQEAVEVAVVHPDTDVEAVLGARVLRLTEPGEDGRPRVLLRFDRVAGSLADELHQFVETGQPMAATPTGVLTEAVRRARAEAQRSPTAPEAWTQLGWSLLALGQDPVAAVQAFQQALACRGDDAAALRGLGVAYALAGDPEMARACARAAAERA
jgi:tetratricopeptide (TPR) repeat protein